MRESQSFILDRRVPLALLLTLLLQGAAAVWWVAGKDSRDTARDIRLDAVEKRLNDDRAYQIEVIERLARLEAHAENQRAMLQQLVASARK